MTFDFNITRVEEKDNVLSRRTVRGQVAYFADGTLVWREFLTGRFLFVDGAGALACGLCGANMATDPFHKCPGYEVRR